MLRIFLCALQVGPGMSGVGVFTLGLVQGFAEIECDDMEIIIGAPDPGRFNFLEGRKGFRVLALSLTRDGPWGRMLATHTAVPRAAEAAQADVVLAPNFVAPLWGRFRTAVFVHDLTFRKYPEMTPAPKRLYYELMVRRSIRRASRVFATTETIGREIVDFAPEAAAKVRVSSAGVQPTFLANDDRETLRAASGVDRLTRPARRDLLFVGTFEPRKNLARILAAHGNLCRNHSGFPALRLVGGKGWADAAIHRALGDHPDPSRVIRLGYCSLDDLKREYDNALALVFPSTYEGFGLPVVEAMARGCPVLTSRGIATEEVAGGAALLVDSTSVGEIEWGMAKLAEDAALRRRLEVEGRRRAQEFTWGRVGRRTLDGLREIGPGPDRARR